MRETPVKRRPWFRYSMRTLLILVTVAAIWFGLLAQSARKQREAVQAVLAAGGSVQYDYQRRGPQSEPRGQRWLRKLIGDEYFQEVVGVVVQSNSADDELLLQIGKLHNLESLTVGALDSNNQRITDAGLRHIGQAKRLRSLNIGFTKVTDQGLGYLAGLPALVHLDLSSTSISDDGLIALKPLKELYSLTASGTNITDRGLSVLVEVANLGELNLAETRITDEGLTSIVKLPTLTRLRIDQLNYRRSEPPRITDEGMKYIAQLTDLRELGIMNLAITDEGLARLSALKKLQLLSASHFEPKYTPAGVAQLQESLPTLKIHH
jgi:hypothetical protein